MTADLTSGSVTPVLHNNKGGGGQDDQSEVTAPLCTADCLQYRLMEYDSSYMSTILLYILNNIIFRKLVVRTESKKSEIVAGIFRIVV